LQRGKTDSVKYLAMIYLEREARNRKMRKLA